MADGRADPKTYTVHDRDDVKDKLKELDVDSVGEIRRAHGSHRHKLAHADDAARLDLHATGSPDQVAANIAALVAAKTELIRQADDVEELLQEARTLATPMNDGHGPIARAMSRAFRERADDMQGTARALTNYYNELQNVLTAIQHTLDSYQLTELSARQRLSASGGDNG